MSCNVGLRRSSDLTLLWLWRRLAATAPIRPLAWEPSYAMGVALKRQKEKKKEKKNNFHNHVEFFCAPLQLVTHPYPPPQR